MPVVEEEDVEVSLENDTVFGKGEARKEWEEEIYIRLYCGSIDLLPQSGKNAGILQKDMKNGVLTMVLDAWGFRPNFSSTTITKFSNDNLEFPAGWSCIRDHLICDKEFLLLSPSGLISSLFFVLAHSFCVYNPNVFVVFVFYTDKYICYYPFQEGELMEPMRRGLWTVTISS
ncbi:uncharacterized protein LOC132285706 [Cornus florida]|uniref:uncharacterized protein LOC132285706 n=1 Tax=Cornus florida TaxID=4283 RepID=UPI00289CCBF3|nr:uncharacterized protein LOC132285706 [Cornus florida]